MRIQASLFVESSACDTPHACEAELTVTGRAPLTFRMAAILDARPTYGSSFSKVNCFSFLHLPRKENIIKMDHQVSKSSFLDTDDGAPDTSLPPWTPDFQLSFLLLASTTAAPSLDGMRCGLSAERTPFPAGCTGDR
ncbi:hypothetical protein E2320_011844 [Naja naja]|nr:hypothetical protein E2320_011844 [Naja naja]